MINKILAIDDSMAIRTFITNTLGKKGSDFHIVTAKNGIEGVELAESSTPDLILLDFILPDMRGDAVCQRLLSNPATASIPVVLMSSSVADIKKTESNCSNVIKAIAKPFTPELLSATVRHFVRSQEPIKEAPEEPAKSHGLKAKKPVPEPVAPAASPQIVFSGHTDAFPLHRTFSAIQSEELTGVLRLHVGTLPVQCFVQRGQVTLATTSDVDSYLRHTSFAAPKAHRDDFESSLRVQKETSCPCFIALSREGGLDTAKAHQLCQEHGERIMAEVWTAGRLFFEFEKLSELPSFAQALAKGGTSADQWMLQTLRHVGDECLSALAWGDLTGIPIYSRDGYERIPHIAITAEEAKFLGQIGDSTLIEMANQLSIPPEKAQRLLYRFLCLGIFEYWPAALFRGES
jgi:CheY-like chemotaxis protein